MRLKYIALTGLAALLFSGEAEGKRGKKAEEVSAAVVLPALNAEEKREALSKAYHSHHAFLEKEGKRRIREYNERLKNCTAELGQYDFCSAKRIGELEELVKAGEAELRKVQKQYVEIMKENTPSEETAFLLTDYHAKCMAKKRRENSSYCQELAGILLQQGALKKTK